jgi:DNA-binding response OmpR family regulator
MMTPTPNIVVKRTRVLVAEDEEDFRSLVVAALREDGYDVLEARNGDELLELITPPVIFRPPDAIVADVWMPGVDGLSVTAGLRGSGWATPIILMTANATREVCSRALELRADGLFQKPFDMSDLKDELRGLLSRGGWRSTAPTLPDLS